MKIVAIGGGQIGGTLQDGTVVKAETTDIDREIIRLTGKSHPRLLFIPTASYDSTGYYDNVREQFTKLGCKEVSPLYLSDRALTKEQIKETILSYDAIYVGGGNTYRMMRVWKKLGVDEALRVAAKKGVVLSGLSAGSICWFICGNSDSRKFSSGSKRLIKVAGLGFIDALNCPHYDTEPLRKPDLKRMMKTTSRIVAIALDECSAIEVVDDKYKVIKSKPSAKAYNIYWKNGEYIVKELAPAGDVGSMVSKS